MKLEKYDEAIADFTAVMAIDPEQSSAYVNRSNCYFNKKEYQKALADAEEAIRCGDNDAYYESGRAYTELGEYEKAIADFDKALLYYDTDDYDYDPGDEDYITEARKKAVELMEKGGQSQD
jgi:tetratricopeptide (TPR) repeat protein